MALILRNTKGSKLTFSEVDGNFTFLEGLNDSSIKNASISGIVQTFTKADGTTIINNIISSSHSDNTLDAVRAMMATSASYAVSASHIEYADEAGSTVSASYAVSASHVEFADEAGSVISASFAVTASYLTGLIESASYALTASHVTNIPASEWDGSRDGDASITGSLIVSGSGVTVDLTDTLAISGSTFSGSFAGDGSGLTNVLPYKVLTMQFNQNSTNTPSLVILENTVCDTVTATRLGAGQYQVDFTPSPFTTSNQKTMVFMSSQLWNDFPTDLNVTNTQTITTTVPGGVEVDGFYVINYSASVNADNCDRAMEFRLYN